MEITKNVALGHGDVIEYFNGAYITFGVVEGFQYEFYNVLINESWKGGDFSNQGVSVIYGLRVFDSTIRNLGYNLFEMSPQEQWELYKGLVDNYAN